VPAELLVMSKGLDGDELELQNLNCMTSSNWRASYAFCR
jgi:hypothetical protein